MPILDVELVVDPAEALQTNLAQRIADSTAPILDVPAARVWVKLRTLARAAYAENEVEPGSTSPVFVKMLQRSPPRGAELQQEIDELTRAIAYEVGRGPDCVHLFYEPPAAGRVAFGGRLVE